MIPYDNISALGRIITSIKAYRLLTNDHRILERNQALNSYLQEVLLSQDWILWQCLTNRERASTLSHKTDSQTVIASYQIRPYIRTRFY